MHLLYEFANQLKLDFLITGEQIFLPIDTGSAGSDHSMTTVYNLLSENYTPNNDQKIVAEGSENERDALISPNGGETWKNGDTQIIYWMYQYITGTSVDLYVLHDDPSGLFDKENQSIGAIINSKLWHKFAKDVPNTGDYTSDPSIMSGTGNAYMVLVVSTEDNSKFDLSDGMFSLNSQ